MRIARVETFLVPPRWLFLRLETDDGIVGWGEPIVEGRAETMRTLIAELTPQLIGADPRRIEDLWQVLTRGGFYRGGPLLSSAVAGIDQALWDIAGKRLGVPVHELLGGPVRDRIKAYAWVNGETAAEISDEIAARREQGFGVVKLNASAQMAHIDTPAAVDRVLERAGSARAALGAGGDFALDFHGRISPPMAARLLPLLEPSAPMFVEEPVAPELASTWLPSLASATSLPLATGERAYSRWDFLPLLTSGIAVAQPDLSHAGGISESRRIAALAETFGVAIAPHCPLGPIALAACLQLDAAIPNFLIQEHGGGVRYSSGGDLVDYLVDTSVFAVADGHFALPTRPGLSVEIDEAAVRAADREGHDWRAPVWRHADGSLAEW